jgi:hypothetical protein
LIINKIKMYLKDTYGIEKIKIPSKRKENLVI